MAIALLFLFNALYYTGMEIFRLAPEHAAFYPRNTALVFLVSLLTAAATPRLFAGRADPGRRVPCFVALAALLLAGPAMIAYFADSSRVWHWLLPAATLMTGPMVFYAFAVAARTERPGTWFGASMSGGMAINLAASRALQAAGLPDEVLLRVFAVAALVLMALLAAGMLWVYWTAEESPGIYSDSPVRRYPATARRGIIARVLGAALLFYGLSGFFATARVSHMVAMEKYLALRLLAIGLCLWVGAVLDARPKLWFKRLSLWCGMVFILVPALMVLRGASPAYDAATWLVVLCQFTFFIGSTLALARLVTMGPWWCLLASTPYLVRFTTLPEAWASRFMAGLDDGVRVGAAIMGCVAFYHLLQEAYRLYGDGVVKGEGGLSEEYGRFFAEKGLTARECDVAEGIARGLSSADIARRLSISENTVNTHVRTILRKSGTSSRKAFVAELTADVFAEE